jgi:hypothetical protein
LGKKGGSMAKVLAGDATVTNVSTSFIDITAPGVEAEAVTSGSDFAESREPFTCVESAESSDAEESAQDVQSPCAIAKEQA